MRPGAVIPSCPPVGTGGGCGDGRGPRACPARTTTRAGALILARVLVPQPGQAPGPLSLQDTWALPFPDLLVNIHDRPLWDDPIHLLTFIIHALQLDKEKPPCKLFLAPRGPPVSF